MKSWNIKSFRWIHRHIFARFKILFKWTLKKYSKVDNYFDIATEAIKEMYRQVGKPKFNKDGIIQKGVIIRHLVLPNHIQNSKNILKWIKQNMPKDIYVSVMAQYFPTYKAKEDNYINRKLTKMSIKK